VFYLFLLVLAVVCLAAYLVFVLNQVPGAKEERLGVLEPLPPQLGKWVVDQDSPEAAAAAREGLAREVRVVHEVGEGLLGGETFVYQARYRNRETDVIERAEPERRVKRRRVKA
jgi:hypothetical protein